MDPHRAEDDMGAWILTAETVVSLFQVLSAKKRRDFTSQIIAKQMILDKCSAEEVWNEWSHDRQSYKDAKLEQVYA